MSELIVSPSQINLFKFDRGLWCLQHFKGKRGRGSAAMELGKAVHFASQAILTEELDRDAAVLQATMQFDRAIEDLGESGEDHRPKILPMTDQAVQAVVALNPAMPSVEQRVTTQLPNGVTVQGYVDFMWDNVCCDLKTGRAAWTSMQPDHLTQLSLYWFMTGLPQSVIYATDKKSVTINADEEGMAECVAWTMKIIDAMLELSEMGEEKALRLCPPNDVYSYRWDSETRALALETWK